MDSIKIVTDSHSGISQEQAKKMGIEVLPMPFMIDGQEYEEGINLSREEFFQKLTAGVSVGTSQPSPDRVMKLWDCVLKEYEQILYMPISSGLSGSCGMAMMLAEQDAYIGRVYVVDNGRVSTPLRRSVMDALELIKEGYSVQKIKQILEASGGEMSIYLAVEDLEYLKRGGRISPTVAALGSLLNIKPVLRLHTGLLESFQKCRGNKKARRVMIDALRHDMETKFRKWFDRGELYLLAASSASEEETAEWIQEIEKAFPGMEVMCDNLSLGVSCHAGPGCLGIGCSCRPLRPREIA